jgi:PleD family two-component response regulator
MRLSDVAKLFRGDDEKISVLAVLPETPDRVALTGIAAKAKWNLRFAATCDSALADLKHHPAAVIICDRDLEPCDWREALPALRAQCPNSRIILTSPGNDDRLWLEVIERGGYDVLTRPFHENRVIQAVRLASTEVRK